MSRTFLISILVICFIAGTWQVSYATTTYECETIPPPPTNCTVDDSATRDKPTIISCRPAGGAPSFEISCSVIYSALPGITWTGVQGYNWLCGADIVVPDGAFQDKKSMCDKFCGICDSGWK